jgi:hypothetical protein
MGGAGDWGILWAMGHIHAGPPSISADGSAIRILRAWCTFTPIDPNYKKVRSTAHCSERKFFHI